jgi:hypothetical protein
MAFDTVRYTAQAHTTGGRDGASGTDGERQTSRSEGERTLALSGNNKRTQTRNEGMNA